MTQPLSRSAVLDILVELLDIPRSYYERAKDRALSLETWLLRTNSGVAGHRPEVFPQGSFRYGTVIRPLLDTEEYDLDLVCALDVSKSASTQENVKGLIGREVADYADRHGFKAPACEKDRCWRLDYADDVSFHMDILPAVPEEAAVIQYIKEAMSPASRAEETIGITDRNHAAYRRIDPNWLRSNPRGFAGWFEDRMREAAIPTIKRLCEARACASVDEIPPYEWKTTLQRSIQLLKRHRDVMFRKSPKAAPISMIITTLAGHAYDGDSNLYSAIVGILQRMPDFIRSSQPRVPNPVFPLVPGFTEDFADAWAQDPQLEDNFRNWHAQATSDVEAIGLLLGGPRLARRVRDAFDLQLPPEAVGEPTEARTVPRIVPIGSPSRPWARDA